MSTILIVVLAATLFACMLYTHELKSIHRLEVDELRAQITSSTIDDAEAYANDTEYQSWLKPRTGNVPPVSTNWAKRHGEQASPVRAPKPGRRHDSVFEQAFGERLVDNAPPYNWGV